MARNHTFRPEREPLRDNDDLQLNNSKIHGPFSFLNPTQAHFNPAKAAKTSADSQTSDEVERPADGTPSEEVPASNVEFKWTSRNNRKGRHAIVYQPSDDHNAPYMVPPATSCAKEILRGIGRMFTKYPIWDVSYLVAFVFTLGSVIWVINAMFALLPFTNPKSEFPGETLYGGGISAFIGATVFEIGSVLLMFEAVNENRTGCFGWALEELYDEHFSDESAEHGPRTRIFPDMKACTHHHQNKGNFVGKPNLSEKSATSATSDPTPEGDKSWVWFPSWNELKTHYFHDLGFLACSSQMFGATVFWISGFTALPGIYTALTTPAKLNGAYWAPQVIGGMGFVVSGTLFMIETQKHWWLPAPTVLGWHIGVWNLIGGVGFTLCPIFGLLGTKHWMLYQASVSTFWGSWAFLIGSAIQWYESLDKHPVEKAKSNSEHVRKS